MEVILLERIENLGQMGDVVKVKVGYARNYLLPQKKALRSTKENLKVFETQKAELEASNLKRKKDAEDMAKRMANLSVVIVRQAAETGQLYGSVTGRDVRDAVREAHFNIERQQVAMDQPFKNLGAYDVKISLHPDVSQTIKVTVARSQEEAERHALMEKNPDLVKKTKEEEDKEQELASTAAAGNA